MDTKIVEKWRDVSKMKRNIDFRLQMYQNEKYVNEFSKVRINIYDKFATCLYRKFITIKILKTMKNKDGS
jgi:hypothetical protein